MPELVANLRRENNALKIQLNSLSAQTFLEGPLVNLYTDVPLPAEKNVWREGGVCTLACEQSLRGALAADGKRKESL